MAIRGDAPKVATAGAALGHRRGPLLDDQSVGAVPSGAGLGPLALAPGRRRAVPSGSAWELGSPELREPFGVRLSMNTAISSCRSVSRASTRARLSGLIPPCAHNSSKRPWSASNSERSDAVLTRATGYSASTAMSAASTASRSAGGIAR